MHQRVRVSATETHLSPRLVRNVAQAKAARKQMQWTMAAALACVAVLWVALRPAAPAEEDTMQAVAGSSSSSSSSSSKRRRRKRNAKGGSSYKDAGSEAESAEQQTRGRAPVREAVHSNCVEQHTSAAVAPSSAAAESSALGKKDD